MSVRSIALLPSLGSSREQRSPAPMSMTAPARTTYAQPAMTYGAGYGHGERSRSQLLFKLGGTENMSILAVNVLAVNFWLLTCWLLTFGC